MEKTVKKIDRRIKKTKRLLREGLTRLMQAKSINDITVKELADSVDINRGTFYLYYKDIYDMLDKVETEMMEEFNELLQSYSVEKVVMQPLILLENIFVFIADNADICIALLSKNGDIGFIKKLTHFLHEKCLKDWIQISHNVDETHFEYAYSYFIYGSVGLIETWLNDGMKNTPQEMAVLLWDLIMNGITLPNSVDSSHAN